MSWLIYSLVFVEKDSYLNHPKEFVSRQILCFSNIGVASFSCFDFMFTDNKERAAEIRCIAIFGLGAFSTGAVILLMPTYITIASAITYIVLLIISIPHYSDDNTSNSVLVTIEDDEFPLAINNNAPTAIPINNVEKKNETHSSSGETDNEMV